MKNINRLATYICKNGNKNTLIHTIPKTNNWIICQKIEIDKWILTLNNPTSNITYNLGSTSEKLYLQIWSQITKEQTKTKISQLNLSKELKKKIKKLNKDLANNYKNFIAKETVRIKVSFTKYWVLGKQKENNLWNIYITDPANNLKELIKKDTTTKSFILFSNIVLKQPFPETKQNEEPLKKFKKFIKLIT